MVRIAAIRLLLALVAHLDLEIYKDQPIGFVSKGQEEKVCCLKRSIYGLKKSSKAWYFRFYEAITSFGLNMVCEDHCVYAKKLQRGLCFLLYMFATYCWLETT